LSIEDTADVIHPTCAGGGRDAEEESAYDHNAAEVEGST
jgi:hypothetical protein